MRKETGRGREPLQGPTIHPLQTIEELRECVRLQERVWGPGFSERVPIAILRIAVRLGGVVAGARDEEGGLAGFVFGLSGWEEGEAVHWSDMLAVRPGLRDAGLGTRLKLYQRRALLERGIRKVYWTFDPLESKNAYLNLCRLGALAREYVEEMYGDSASPLHAGVGTDRLVALWELDSPRVVERVAALEQRGTAAGSSKPDGVARARSVLDGVEGPQSPPAPGEPHLGCEDRLLSVAVPAVIQEVKDRDPALARAWREATRGAFTHYLARGWEVRELERGARLSRYLLVRGKMMDSR